MNRAITSLLTGSLLTGGLMALLLASPGWAGIREPIHAEPNLKAGTEVHLELVEKLRSSDARKGMTVKLRVAEDVVDPTGAVVVRKGAPAQGTVADARGGGLFGKRAGLELSLDWATAVDGQSVPLRTPERGASWRAKGKASVLGKVTSFLGKGGGITVDAGSVTVATVDRPMLIAAERPARKTFVLRGGDRVTGVLRRTENGVHIVATDLGEVRVRTEEVTDVIEIPAAGRFKLLD